MKGNQKIINVNKTEVKNSLFIRMGGCHISFILCFCIADFVVDSGHSSCDTLKLISFKASDYGKLTTPRDLSCIWFAKPISREVKGCLEWI